MYCIRYLKYSNVHLIYCPLYAKISCNFVSYNKAPKDSITVEAIFLNNLPKHTKRRK